MEAIAQSVPLVWGTGIHAGVKALLKNQDVQSAVDYALDDYASQCSDRNFDIDELESQSFVYAEGKALIEGFTRAWALERLPDFIATYEILEVEHEALWKDWAEGIDLAYRPDALLRKRNTGGIYIFNLKSSYAWGERELKASRYNVQGLSELAAVEHRLGEKVAGIQDEIFIKGSRYKQKDGSFHQSTFLVHPWLKAGITSDDDQWAWKYYYDKDGSTRSIGKAFSKVNVWEHMSMKEWIDMLASGNVQGEFGNPLAELFVTPIAHERNEAELQEWLHQARAQEAHIKQHVRNIEPWAGTNEERRALDEFFPMYRHSCFQYQRTCEFAPVCHERLKLDCGLYQPRVDHHAQGVIE